MWPPTTDISAGALTRPRVAVAAVSAVAAAASLAYLAYQSHCHPISGNLQRSNAVRRSRRDSRRGRHPLPSSRGEVAAADEAPAAAAAAAADSDAAAAARPIADDESSEWWDDAAIAAPQRAGHNIVTLLFRVSEDNARRSGCVHRGCQCNSCGMVPIRGIRYRCANCADFDLCETCEAQGVHVKTHVFYKIRVPAPPFGHRHMQPVWYTGDPETNPANLSKALITRLTRETGFERPELESFWEQWTYMANREWREDPDALGNAMDRLTFERCLVPTGGSRHSAPNLIHDRMFSFYDTNNDGLIGFSEFLHGLAYRKRKDKLRKIFEGYDLDGDGYVSRRDFLRVFRAYYVLYKQMHRDIVEGLHVQLRASSEAQNAVNSRLPISSFFGREGGLPNAERALRWDGKTYYVDGRVDIDDAYRDIVVENGADSAARLDILTSLFAYRDEQANSETSAADSGVLRRPSASASDRAYWDNLLHPPAHLEELPDVLAGISQPRMSVETDDEGDEEPLLHHGSEDGHDGDGDGADGHIVIHNEGDSGHGLVPNHSELRAELIMQMRRNEPALEKFRQELARDELHERWQRRQFYLDEEEGCQAPRDWDKDEDILAKISTAVEEAHADDVAQTEPPARSRSSSKVRFAGAVDDYETRSNPSTSSRSVPERWGGMEIPDAERDAGKEILYQVTQQAFNEMLDPIFRLSEERALDAARTKRLRQKYRVAIDAARLANKRRRIERDERRDDTVSRSSPAVQDGDGHGWTDNAVSREGPMLPPSSDDVDEEFHLSDFTLPSSTELSVAGDDVGEGNDGVDDDDHDHDHNDDNNDDNDDDDDGGIVIHEVFDPTLPQFRPNTWPPPHHQESKKSRRRLSSSLNPGGAATRSSSRSSSSSSSSNNNHDSPRTDKENMPSDRTLLQWHVLNLAEAQAVKRGGWGRLDYTEFERYYKRLEAQGIRLDYIGSWIDFCIP